MAPRIEILQQQGDWITSLKQRVDTLESEVHTAQEELTQGHREIGVDHDAVAGEPEPVPRTIDTFRGPARTIRRAKARLKKAKEQLADLQEKDRLLTERLENEMDRHGATDLSQAIERLSELTALLRRRQGLSERMAEMENYLAEMEDQNAYLIENQALPLPALAGLGLLAIGGAVLATLWGLGHIHVLFGILGLVAIAAGIGVKIYVERSNARKLEGNQRQLSLLMSQIEQAREESAAIDVKLPPGEGAIDYQMEKAERQLAALEQLVPYETQRREIERQIVSAKEHLETLQRTLHAAMKRWRDLLQRARLPVDLTPVQVKDVLARYDEMGDLRRRKDQRQEELHQKKRELEQVSQRIDQLIAETGVSFPDAWGVLEKLRQLGERLSENENLLKQRETLREQARQIRRQGNKAKTLLAQQSRRRRERLVEFGVESTQELVARSERYSEYLQLVHQRQRVQQEIDAAIGGYCGEEVIARQLAPGRRDHLEKILEQTRRRIDAAKDRLRHTLQHQGQLAERLETLSRDRTSARKHLELGTLHEKLRNAKSQWQQRAVACRILEDIRQHYERDRQPETLQEASAFFRRLTRDGYRRVWTPMGENSLYVDDPQGNTFDVQWLSRGTREQLFVALRLALAASFARRGALLPVVMDDVLVNFDMARAASAAAVLRQFAASGRQVLLFTCHRHVCRIFEMLEVPVHTLPSPKPAKRSLASAPAPKKEEDEVDNHSEAPPSNKEEIPVEQTTDHEPIEDEEDLPYESEEERREEEYEEENLEDEAPLEPEEESEPEEETPLAEKSSETVVLRLDPPTAEDKMEMEERPPLAPPTPTPLAADEDSTDSFEEQEPYLPFENDESYPSTAFVSRVENAIGFFNGEEYFDDYLLHDSAEETENAEPEYRNSETERFPREVGETSNTDELTEILEESPADPSEEEAAGEMVEEKMSDETEIDPDSEMDLFSEDIASQTINDDLNDESAETTTVENIEPEETTEGTAEFLPSETEPEKDPPSSFEEPLFPEEDASREWDDYDQAEDWQEEEAESPDETPEALGEEEAAFEVEDESDEEWYEDDEDEDEEGHVDEPPWDEDIEEFDDYEEYDDEEWEEEEDE
jgi:DNA repair exonuclease SbcCD ATPase subunit